MFATDDTIVAIATPPGRGGIGVVRVSGPRALSIVGGVIDRGEPLEPRQATFARVVEPAADARIRAVDEVVVTWFAAPHSYTGDDVVEISGHGSPVLLGHIVSLAVAAGARLAEPGEFTLRAYLHGKIDLVQAEAVRDLVDAVTPRQARVAMDQLEGTLTGALRLADAALFDLSARLEASLDFPEEGFHFITRGEAVAELASIRASLGALAMRGREGRLIREGRVVVIAGRPNTGKSSLFNALAGAARAIVTEVAGTTRDLLTERVDVFGVPVTLVDTAGLREATEVIEAEGVRRAEQARSVADLVLIVLDGSSPISPDDERLLGDTRSMTRVVAVNKSDLPQAWDVDVVRAHGRAVSVSALSGDGLDEFRRAFVGELIEGESGRDAPAITNARHVALVERACDALDRAVSGLEAGATEELVLAEVGDARQALEDIAGRRAPEDLLRHIFSRFCIGK